MKTTSPAMTSTADTSVGDDARVVSDEVTALDLRLEILRDCFPEAFVEGKCDLARLASLVGSDSGADGQRRFGLDWPGKGDAQRLLRLPALGTLRPDRGASVEFDSGENVFITGENLEVMKLMQRAYFGAFKMIYMDPPYNTDGDHIYHDDYTQPLRAYLRYSGQVNSDGDAASSNIESRGRFHSRWLSMMLPRLFVARNLLSENGVIFVSIDDHESHHLRLLMDEIFGSENFVCSFVWEKRYSPPPDTKDLGYVHENVMCYRRSDAFHAALLPMTEEQKARYKHRAGDEVPWKPADYTCRYTAKERPNLFYPLRKRGSGFAEIDVHVTRTPDGALRIDVTQPAKSKRDLVLKTVGKGDHATLHVLSQRRASESFEFRDIDSPRSIAVHPDGPVLLQWPKATRVWACSREEHLKNEAAGVVWWPESAEVPAKKKFVTEIRQGAMPMSLLKHEIVGHTDEATKELRKWFPEVKVTPKPTRLIRHLMQIAGVASGDLVLDCFAGTGTTAEAVADANDKDAVAARFVLVQLPEPLKHTPGRTMADLGRERAARRLQAGGGSAGLRCFSLATSCFRAAPTSPTSEAEIAQQLKLSVDNVERGSTRDDLLFEVLLKSGFSLTSRVEQVEAGGVPVFSVADGMLLVCVEKDITPACVRALVARAPQRVVCLDVAFQGQDNMKTNVVLEMRSHEIEFRTI